MSSHRTLPPPEPEREPMPDVSAWSAAPATDWASRPDAELEDRLRDAVRAAEPMHFDPDRLDQLTPCGLDVPEIHGYVSTNPALVTCPGCAASLVDSQLPPQPGPVLTPEQRAEIVEVFADEARFELSPDQVEAAIGRLQAAERRTVGLEVLTDELRALGTQVAHSNVREEMEAARVGLVLRINGEAVAVPDTDVPWTSTSLGPVKALRGLLTEMISGKNRLERQEGRPVELLMPTPEVLAALAGTPMARYTVALEMSYGTVPPGSYVRTEVEIAPGHREVIWELLTDRRDCTDPDCTAVETGQPDCRVVTVEGRGVQHVARWWPVSARVPASTEVEL